MITQRPDLFAAAVPNAGHYDLLRFHRFTVGAGWIPEFGTPESPEDYRHLRAYSPLHHVRSGRTYPKRPLTGIQIASTGDPVAVLERVQPGESVDAGLELVIAGGCQVRGCPRWRPRAAREAERAHADALPAARETGPATSGVRPAGDPTRVCQRQEVIRGGIQFSKSRLAPTITDLRMHV